MKKKMRERGISMFNFCMFLNTLFITCVNIFFIRTPPTPCEKKSGSALDNLTTLPFFCRFVWICYMYICTYIYIYVPPLTLIIPTLNGVLLYWDYQKNMIAVFSSLISCACIWDMHKHLQIHCNSCCLVPIWTFYASLRLSIDQTN